MSWSSAASDCRRYLNDGPTDKLRFNKQVIGQKNGTNKVFKTFEVRRLSTFVGTPTSPAGVFKNDSSTPEQVDSEDLTSGLFVLHTAPANNDRITATYYVQWFTDDEIIEFLKSASEWIGLADNYADIPESLRPAAKEYVAAMGYQKLATRAADNMAETYQLHDAPDKKRMDPAAQWMTLAEKKLKIATTLRDDVYKNRKGQALAPISGNISGCVRDVAPKR